MWRFVTAYATGTSHVKAGLPCQDRLAHSVVGNRTLVAAVADGAGSAAWAEEGARIAVGTVVQYLSHALDAGRVDYRVMLREAAMAARETVFTAAWLSGKEPRDFASTLLVVVVGPDGGSALQIGDGVIVVSDGGNGWGWVFWPQRGGYADQLPNPNRDTTAFRWVFWPQRGEYVNTTRFLTDADAVERLQVAPRLGKVTDIALMTDGLEPLALHYVSTSVHEPFFRGMFRPLWDADEAGANEDREIRSLSAALKNFLSSERIGSRTDDDTSLILATRRQQDDQK